MQPAEPTETAAEAGARLVGDDPKQQAIQGRKAHLAAVQRKHYAINAKRLHKANPRVKSVRVTTPRGGVPANPGPSEKALARAARQS